MTAGAGGRICGTCLLWGSREEHDTGALRRDDDVLIQHYDDRATPAS